MLLSAISGWDAVLIALITAVAPIIATVVNWWIAKQTKDAIESGTASAVEDSKAVAAEVKEVKTALESTKTSTDTKLDALHEIANGQTLIHLRLTAANSGIIAELLRREADRTKATADNDAAKVAREQHETDQKNLAQHEATLKALGGAEKSAPATGKHVTIGITTPQVVVNQPKEG